MAVALMASLYAAPALAQVPGMGAGTPIGESGPDESKVRVRLGPLLLGPTVSLTNLGIDQNVFNEPTDQNPKKDFTFTVQPATELWLRLGPTWVTGKIQEDLVWFKTYASERTANNVSSVGWYVPLNRLAMTFGATHRNVRDRPGFEIDARSQRSETEYTGRIEVRALTRTFIAAGASRQKIDFDKDAVFLNSNLQFELSRVTTSAGLALRYQVTPLTSVSLAANRSEDRFAFSSLRDSDSTAASVSIAFDPAALIKGSATFGYRDFQPLAPALPNFRGTTASVDLFYTLLGTTRFGVTAIRDLQYSYDVNQPYYLLTGFTASIAQQLFGPLDVVGRAGAQHLAYRDRAGVVIPLSNRVDSVRSYGGGIGYRLSRDLRLGFDVDHANRVSDVSQRQYDDLRFGLSVTYVF